MLPTLLRALALSLALPAQATQVPLPDTDAHAGALTFSLRHAHAATDTHRVVFADVGAPHALTLGTQQHAVQRARAWPPDVIAGPNVSHRHTVRELAKMTSNAYLTPGDAGWYDLDGRFNISMPFGWEDDAQAFRGHIFATADNSTVVVSIKGTSTGFLGGGGPTKGPDKRNNNLLFSCCCAKVGFSWTPVCGCHRGGWRCDVGCLEESLAEDGVFYGVGTNLYNNVSYMYPTANVWLIGHSLGGSLAALLGATFGVPVVAFEAPGEKMAAQRLHLPSPPSTQHITHIYHTADPIAMGTCNGVLSSCAIAGYAMESRCHLGKAAVYDTVTRFGWSVNVVNHAIKVVIDDVLKEDWDPDGGREVPLAAPEEDCVECYKWEYGDFGDGAAVYC